jgi:hypothetical protein
MTREQQLESEAKERPILFSALMVRAILEGRKTQTRRVVNKLVGFGPITEFGATDTRGYDWAFRDKRRLWNDIRRGQLREACPYGQPGDQLWVRETWNCADYSTRHQRRENVRYRATDGEELRWRSPIHMPRWASRILLEIVSVRVERLQEIRERDCDAEGLEPIEMEMRPHFRSLWESINGPGSWETNPWVWVIEFRRVGGPNA